MGRDLEGPPGRLIQNCVKDICVCVNFPKSSINICQHQGVGTAASSLQSKIMQSF